ncbi:MAG: hypothetical protein AAGC96_17980 [Pseudomonadota bacterium]
MSEKPSTQAKLKEMEAMSLLAEDKPSHRSCTGAMLVAAVVAAAVGWIAAGVVEDRRPVLQSFYQPDVSPPIGNRLMEGPALVRTGGILLLSDGAECPLGSTQLSDVAIQVIKQQAEQYEVTARRTAETEGWTGRTFITCKI